MKKQTQIAVAPTKLKSDTLSDLNSATYARQISLDLTAPVDALWQQVVKQEEASKRHFAAFGLLLLTIKKSVPHGDFLADLERRGFEERQAQRAMSYAQFVFSRPTNEQAQLLDMPRSKVCALAAADPEVLEVVMDEGLNKVTEWSSRELARALNDVRTQLSTALNQLKEKSASGDTRTRGEYAVPAIVSDARAELAALIKKAELAITSLHPVGVEIVGLVAHEEAAEWVKPSLRLGLSGLLAVRELVDGSIKSFVEAMGEDVDRVSGQPDVLAFLDASEIKGVAEDWARLTAVHQHEAALREHERAQARPKGKGRPSKAPEAPKA